MMGKDLNNTADFKPVSLECLAIHVEGREFVPTSGDVDSIIAMLRKHGIIKGIDLIGEFQSEKERKEIQFRKYDESGELLMEFIPASGFTSYIANAVGIPDVKFDMYTMVDANTPSSSDDPRTDFDTSFYILEMMFESGDSINLPSLAAKIEIEYTEFLVEVEKYLESRGKKSPRVKIGYTTNLDL